jgi:HSP20 family protein
MTTLFRLMQALMPISPPQPAWRPTADIYRCRDGWLVKLDLAGVCTEDIELSVREAWLTVRGIRRDWCIREGHQAYSMEISYNRFERAIELPCDLETAQISTEYRDGMLLVYVRKSGNAD